MKKKKESKETIKEESIDTEHEMVNGEKLSFQCKKCSNLISVVIGSPFAVISGAEDPGCSEAVFFCSNRKCEADYKLIVDNGEPDIIYYPPERV